ncbi:2OG-Fe(II) oxygenase [Aurantibacillus circumpalustris]|uniref:2OG-Fe(II) oxygenase n=1 Tax=Aurantibacillus circumpalustris TaxID=3036359 RepID=UPI00295BC556|nr:2OG-Fe(II) oxygenase [Aurantibacillus circumpalustris]
MDTDFENLITRYLSTQIGITEDFFSKILTAQLKENLLTLYSQNSLLAAGTGNNKAVMHNNEVRSDAIYWLDRKHNNASEDAFFDRIDDFISYLNKTCYTGITSCEFQYSFYETGSFYTKHLDRFKNNSSRVFSMVSYLNSDWEHKDGGHLIVQQTVGEQKIAPTQGKTVFFKSDELLHEVEVTHAPRMSIAGWLKRD